MSPEPNANLYLDFLKVNPMLMSMMACAVAVAMCLDFADALAWRDTLDAFPVKKVDASKHLAELGAI